MPRPPKTVARFSRFPMLYDWKCELVRETVASVPRTLHASPLLRSLKMISFHPEELSEARRFKEVKIQTDECTIVWITTALQTVGNERRNLQRVVIYIYCSPNPFHVITGNPFGEKFRKSWTDLDNALAQPRESRVAQVKIELVYISARVAEVPREVVEGLLPEMMKREIELVNVIPSH